MSSEKIQTSRAIGIDLGTTYSCVANFKNGEMTVIVNKDGKRTTPSIIAFDKNQRFVGEPAIACSVGNPSAVVYDAKRMIGRGFDDPKIQEHMRNWSFKIVKWDAVKQCEDRSGRVDADVKDNIRILIDGKYYDPVEMSAAVLTEMKMCAEIQKNHAIDTAVVTVPAYFNDHQRSRTKTAAEIAGFKNVRLLNEPTAAAMAYGFASKKSNVGGSETIFVFDLGGGTFDVSCLKFECNPTEGGIAEVLGTDGDTFLGGVDFDNCLFKHCADFWNRKNPDEPLTEKMIRRLRTSCEAAKQRLSATTQTQVHLEYFTGTKNFELDITRTSFERMCEALFERCLEKVKGLLLSVGGFSNVQYKADGMFDYNAMGKSKSEITRMVDEAKGQIERVLMIGGSSRIPKVQEMISQFFGKQKVDYSINPDEAVALGASYQAALIAADVEFSAADTLLLLDTIPLSLGIETAGGVCTELIKKNTTIPYEYTQTFTTYSDMQTAVTINIFEGNRPLCRDNHKVDSFVLENLTPAPRGIPQIEVTMAVDSNGILTVTALEKGRNNSKSLTINTDKRIIEEEQLRQYKENAEKFADEDRKALELINARNELDNQAWQAKSLLKECKNEAAKNSLIARITKIEDALQNQSLTLEDVRQHKTEMEAITRDISAAMGAPGAAGAGMESGPRVEEVD